MSQKSCNITNQFLHQLDPSMRSAVLANVQNRVCFHLADEDARSIATKGSGLEPEDFTNLGAFEFYARLVARSAIQPWCSGRSLPPAPATSDPKNVLDASRNAYAQPRADVEAEIRTLTQRPTRTDSSDLGPRRRSGEPS